MESTNSFEVAMAMERATASRRVLWARVAWTALTVTWCVASGYLNTSASYAMRAYLPVGVVHLGLATLLLLLSLRIDREGQRAWLAVLLLDLPLVFLGQYFAIDASRNPLGRAEGVSQQFVLLILVTQLGMRGRHVFTVAGAAAVLHMVLVRHAGMVDLGPRLLLTPAFFALVAVVCAYLPSRLVALVRSVVAREQAAIRLRRYFSPEVTRHIEAGLTGEMAGSLAEVSVLVVDIRGFTALASRLDPPAVVLLLNTYLSLMVQAVFDRGGTLDKFVGDGLIAYFGAPLPQADHPGRAVACGLELCAHVAALNADRARQGQPTVQIGVGINTGTAVVGDVGSPQRREFTIIGDAVNVSARTEALTKKLGVEILCTAATRDHVAASFEWTAMEPQLVKGKAEPLQTYVPRARREDGFRSAPTGLGHPQG